MPKKDALHELVRRALMKAGWTITADPFVLKMDRRKAFPDLGAHSNADGALHKIIVEIKAFDGESFIADLEQALGQYVLYRELAMDRFPDYEVVLALPHDKYLMLFNGTRTQALLRSLNVKLLLFNSATEEVVQWIMKR